MTKTGPTPESEDRELVSVYLETRGEAAFRSLYRRHTPRLYGMALRMLGGDRRDAEEVIQETWLRAAQQLDRFAWRSSLSTWLTGIVLNLCRDHLRRQQSRPRAVQEDVVPAKILKVAKPRTGDGVDLQKAIFNLAPRYRQVLLLHDVEGYTHPEISKLLGIEVGTSKSQLFQARRAMRAHLSQESEGR